MVIFVVAIVATSICVVGGCAKAPIVAKCMVDNELIVGLYVVVCVVVIVANNLSVDYDFTLGIVATILC